MWPGQRDKCVMPVRALRRLASSFAAIVPMKAQINAAAEVGAPFIEIHTGCYASAETDAEQAKELARIASAATWRPSGAKVNAGHG